MLASIVILTIGVLAALIIFNQLRTSAGRRQVGRSTPVAPWRDAAPAPLADSADDPITRTLESLRRVDDHPLYTMTYYGAYGAPPSKVSTLLGRIKAYTPWACSLFVAFADSERAIYGRNFDWDNHPALLLFTDPPDGYASVSMVDIHYLGFNRSSVDNALASWKRRRHLLRAPFLPFDGMNEHGLTVGMAAVDYSRFPKDSGKRTVGSLHIIRLMLDRARTTDEAIALLKQYNIDFFGGPPIHYLIADPGGRSVVVEFKDGAIHIIPNDKPWQSATNFYLTGAASGTKRQDWRYNTADERLSTSGGVLDWEEAIELLKKVAQYHTRWSIVYSMSTGDIHIATSRRFDRVHTFRLALKQR